MDNMPVRGSGAAHRPAQHVRVAERAPATKEDEPRLPRYSQSGGHAPKEEPAASKRKMFILIGAGVGAFVLLLAIILAVFLLRPAPAAGTGMGIDSSKYQAVFFTNGQVYFGKLQAFSDQYLKLTDVFYLQTQQTEQDAKSLQKTSTDQNNVQLTKLGAEIHGPQDEMIISKDQVLFYENLKSDGKVVTSINKFKNAK